MSLQRLDEQPSREVYGYSFPMRVAGSAQNVRVVVSDDALAGGALACGEDSLRAQLEAERNELEDLARQKYNRGRVSDRGEILITANDALSIIE